VRTLIPAIVLGALAAPAAARSLEVIGYAGVLGEWELIGTVTPQASGAKSFAGPLKLTHVGVCTQDGPEVKNGEMRFALSGSPPSRMKATLLIDGVECTYNARLSDSYSGMMSCPDKRAVPLKIWVK
jgi:hypothetical protein